MRKFIGGTAKSFLRAVQAQSWHDVRRALHEEFGYVASTSSIHKMLANRRKQPNETAQQFCIAMREIAMNKVDEADLVSYVVDGLTQDRNERLFFASATNFAELRILLTRFKETVGNVPEMKSQNQPFVRRNPFSATAGATSAISGPLRCFNCQEVGHMASRCEKPRRSSTCFLCGQEGHIQALCPRRQTPSQVANVDAYRDGQAGTPDNNTDLSPTPTQNTNGFKEEVSFLFSNGKIRVVLTLSALLDTGSPSCFIQAKFVPIALINSAVASGKFVGLNSSPLCVLGTICCSVKFRNQRSDNVLIHVVKDGTMSSVAILGRNFMTLYGLQLKEDPSCNLSVALKEVMNIDVCDIHTTEPAYEVNPLIPAEIKCALNDLVDSSMQPHLDDVPSDVRCEIKLIKDGHFYSTPRRLSYHEKDKVKIILDDLLLKNIIRPSHSPYSSPIVLVKKKSKDLRMCVDYRTLNKMTARDNF